MDIVVKGRHLEVSDRFRRHAAEKLTRIEKLDGKIIRLDVEVSEERNRRLSSLRQRVEITVRSRGPVIRAEAAAEDKYTALDAALDKLENRLRRCADRRRVHHGSRTPVSVSAATASAAASAAATAATTAATTTAGAGAPPGGAAETIASGEDEEPDTGPMVVREKVHEAAPMTLDQALFEMELVGHDFFLFCDKDTGLPSVVYRRKGYDYGVIRLDTSGRETH
ncbi:MAG TPA: ribosome-associated translation inhibitor RaiA [Mycobacteriales bacterium]|nr:ribosome-associated translation inhibitor RaiA [Mycobacteriales bacterium]